MKTQMYERFNLRYWSAIHKKMAYNADAISRIVGRCLSHHYDDLGGEIVPMQATGVEDKNGKGVYEGDVISIEGRFNLFVEYFEGCHMLRFCLGCGNDVWGTLKRLVELERNAGTVFEIVGNIYENPVLLGARVAEQRMQE